MVVEGSSTSELRKEPTIVFGNIEELENKKLAAIQAISIEEIAGRLD
jgi:hypothetical protein